MALHENEIKILKLIKAAKQKENCFLAVCPIEWRRRPRLKLITPPSAWRISLAHTGQMC